jgi:16S rRNA (cytosine967-C5)-methyltransferase
MTPGARFQAAIELLQAIDSDPAPADAVADRYFRARRYAGSKDRRAVIDRVFAALRRRAQLDWWIARLAPSLPLDARSRMLAAAPLLQHEPPPAVDELCSGEGHSPPQLNEAERFLLQAIAGKQPNDSDMPAAVRLECPLWLEPSLHRAWGSHWEAELEALNGLAPVDLRVNCRKTTRHAARQALTDAGIEAQATLLSPVGLRLGGRVNLNNVPAYSDGLVEVQDEGSQLAAILVDARPGMAVADLCAGGGGKTLVLAEAMNLHPGDGARLAACDAVADRLKDLPVRLRRGGFEGVEIQPLGNRDRDWFNRNADKFDRVLIDVPCSGSGTWRRNPQARWRLTAADLAAYNKTQTVLLDVAARLVKPEGRLVYVTCSILREENEDRIEAFLTANPAFATLPAQDVWRSVLATACPVPGPLIRFSPAACGTDGFFVAVLERRA